MRIPFARLCIITMSISSMQSALDGDIEWLHVRGHQAAINPPHGTCSQALARGEGSTLGSIWRCHSRWAYAMRLVSKRLDGDVKILQALTPRSRGAQIRELSLRSCMSCQKQLGPFLSSFRRRMVVTALVICLDSSMHRARSPRVLAFDVLAPWSTLVPCAATQTQRVELNRDILSPPISRRRIHALAASYWTDMRVD